MINYNISEEYRLYVESFEKSNGNWVLPAIWLDLDLIKFSGYDYYSPEYYEITQIIAKSKTLQKFLIKMRGDLEATIQGSWKSNGEAFNEIVKLKSQLTQLSKSIFMATHKNKPSGEH